MTAGSAASGAILRRRPIARINRPLPRDHARQWSADKRGVGEKRRNRRRVGLLGGSFNPAHEGHRAISLEAMKRLGLDQVWWLVSPQNPLKSQHDMADFPARLASASTVAAGHSRIIVTDLEQKIGTQYTIDTVKWLIRNQKHDFVWLIGADNLLQLPKWQSWRSLLNLVPIAVFDREPYSYKALAGRVAQMYANRRIRPRKAKCLALTDPPAWVYFRLRRHRVSSTAIRNQQGWPVDDGTGASRSTQSGATEGASS